MKPIHLIVSLLLLLFSCKHEDEPTPSPIAVKDVYEMYDPEPWKVCTVLENDLYLPKAFVSTMPYNLPFGHFESVDTAILFVPYQNAYGSFYRNYTLHAQNGQASARVTVKRGTDEQIQTATIIYQFSNLYVNNPSMYDQRGYLYAVDGDTSYFYHLSESESIRFETTREIAIYSSLLPAIEGQSDDYYFNHKANYSIDTDGILHALDNDQQEVSLKFLGTFSATAKKFDQSGTVEVKGFTLEYEGKRYDYVVSF